jgi:DNA-binding MarR family transcriptional regulator
MPDDSRDIPFHVLLVRVFRTHAKIVFGRLAPDGVTQGQPRILRYLTAHDGCLQREIAEDNELEPATVTNALAVMEKLGYVRRETPDDDRRASRVNITAKGRRALERADVEFGHAEEICFRGFSEKEKRQTADFLGRMLQNLGDVGESADV